MPHTHGHKTRHQAKQGERERTDTEVNMEVQEEQPTTEMEVTTDNTQENQPEVNQPEKPTQTGDANLMEMLRSLIENNQKKIEETLNKNNESLKENLTEELGKKIDNTNKNMDTLKADLKEDNQKLCQQMAENNKKMDDKIDYVSK